MEICFPKLARLAPRWKCRLGEDGLEAPCAHPRANGGPSARKRIRNITRLLARSAQDLFLETGKVPPR